MTGAIDETTGLAVANPARVVWPGGKRYAPPVVSVS
jgi:hypothetical protein